MAMTLRAPPRGDLTLRLTPDRLLDLVLERLLERLPRDMARALPAFATRERATLLAELAALAVPTPGKAKRRTARAKRDTPRKAFDAAALAALAAGGFAVDDVVSAGSSRASDVLGRHERVDCRRCGQPISIVYVTSHGALGGDCLATLTGDASTRSRLARLQQKLLIAVRGSEHARFRIEAAEPGLVRLVRLFPHHERTFAVHKGLAAELVALLEEVASRTGYVAKTWGLDDEDPAGDAIIVNAKYSWRAGSPPTI